LGCGRRRTGKSLRDDVVLGLGGEFQLTLAITQKRVSHFKIDGKSDSSAARPRSTPQLAQPQLSQPKGRTARSTGYA
jgi:hypothetical protein